MRRIAQLLIRPLLWLMMTIWSVSSSFADGSRLACFQLSVTTASAGELTAYISLPEYVVQKDSLKAPGYLERTLMMWTGPDTFRLYRQKLVYQFEMEGWAVNKVHGLQDEVRIPAADVNTITIIDSETFDRYGTISNMIEGDVGWMKDKPLEMQSLAGEYCEYFLFRHDPDKRFDEALKRFRELTDSVDAEEADSVLYDHLYLFDGLKVVVISFCFC